MFFFLLVFFKVLLEKSLKVKIYDEEGILLSILIEVKSNYWKSMDFRKKMSYFIFLSMLNCNSQC